MAKQLELYEKQGKAPQERHLGPPALYAITETGPLNTYVHVWAYDRRRRPREEAGRDAGRPRLAEPIVKASSEAGYLLRQENKILTAAPFFKLAR